MAEALAQPGVVIRKLRGTEAEHLAALGPMPEKTKATTKPITEIEQASPPPPAKNAKPAPRPSRDALDDADMALAKAQAEQKATLALMDKQIAALREEKSKVEAAQEREQARTRLLRRRARYDAALEKWRG